MEAGSYQLFPGFPVASHLSSSRHAYCRKGDFGDSWGGVPGTKAVERGVGGRNSCSKVRHHISQHLRVQDSDVRGGVMCSQVRVRCDLTLRAWRRPMPVAKCGGAGGRKGVGVDCGHLWSLCGFCDQVRVRETEG